MLSEQRSESNTTNSHAQEKASTYLIQDTEIEQLSFLCPFPRGVSECMHMHPSDPVYIERTPQRAFHISAAEKYFPNGCKFTSRFYEKGLPNSLSDFSIYTR